MNEWLSPVLDKPITDIKQGALKDLYINHIVEKAGSIKRKACRNIHTVLRQVFRYANDVLGQQTIDIEKTISSFKDVNPKLFATDTPTLGGDVTKRLTKDELAKVITLCNETQNVYTCAILFAIYSGLRVSEVCALHKTDIDFDNSLINISHALKSDYTIAPP